MSERMSVEQAITALFEQSSMLANDNEGQAARFVALTKLLIEKGIITEAECEKKLGEVKRSMNK